MRTAIRATARGMVVAPQFGHVSHVIKVAYFGQLTEGVASALLRVFAVGDASMKLPIRQMAWMESYRTGLPIIDAEHKNLFIAVNTYVDAVMRGQGLRCCGAILDTITDYAGTHFKREEQLMQSTSYHGFAEHKVSHTNFLVAVVDFRKLLEEGLDIDEEVAYFLSNWLSTHVIGLDAEMGAFIRASTQLAVVAA
jgi:hemerythrin